MVNKLDLCFCVLSLLFICFSDFGVAQRKLNRNVPVGADVKQNLNFDCPEEFGYYPHPTDCTQYYVCVFGGALLESCTGGLMYSHELQTCDWPRNVGCEGLGEVAITASSPASQPLNKVQSERVRYTVASAPAPPPPPQPAAIVTSRGQPKHAHHATRQEIIQAKHQQTQQQLYAEAEETLPPAEEIENDRQQRVYRGQPSTIGQVQRDRDGVRHSNAIPVSTTRGEKIGVISFGTQQQPIQQQYRELLDDLLTNKLTTTKKRRKRQIRRSRIEEAITPQTQQIAIVQSTPPSRTIYNGSQHYDPTQYDPYYALYEDDVELYKDVDYTPHYSTNNKESQSSNQHPYRGTPATVTVQSTLAEEKPIPQRSNSYVQNTYSTQAQNIYQPVQDYSEDNYQTQVDDQSNYRQPSRQSSRGDRNELNYIVETSKSSKSSKSSTTSRPTSRTVSVYKQNAIPSRSPNATANQARPQSIFITLSAPLSGSPEQKESRESDTPKPTSTPAPDPSVPSKPTPDKDPTNVDSTSPKNNGSIFLSLTAGFAHRRNQNRDHLTPVTYKPNFVHRPTTQEPNKDSNVNSKTINRNPPFSLSSLPTADKKSITIQLSTRLLTPTIKTPESLQQLSSSDVRSTENPNKREVAFNRNSYSNSLFNTSNQNIVPTTYAPSRVFLAMLLPKSNKTNDDISRQQTNPSQDLRTVISSQEFEEKSKNLFKTPPSYKENHEKQATKNLKPQYDVSSEYSSTESYSERNTRRIVSRINFGTQSTTTKGPETRNPFVDSEEYFNTARKTQPVTTTTERVTKSYENRPYLVQKNYFTSTVPSSTERINQFKFSYFASTTPRTVAKTTKTFVHQIGLEDVTTEPTRFVPTTTQAAVSSSVKSDYFQSQDENVRRTTENARYVSTTTKGYNLRDKFVFGSGERVRYTPPTTEQYLESSEQYYEKPKNTSVGYKTQSRPIFSSNGFKYVNSDYYQSKTSTTTERKTTEYSTTENSKYDYTFKRFNLERSNYDASTESIGSFGSSSEDYSSNESGYESSSTTESEYSPKHDSKFRHPYTTTTFRPKQVVTTTTTTTTTTTQQPEPAEQKPRCTTIECELLPNRNTKKFMATVEVPTVPEILASIEEKPNKHETDISPTYKLKPIILKPDLTNNITLSYDTSRNSSIPARLSRVNTAIKSLIGFGGTQRNVPKCNEKQLAPNAKCNEIQNQRTSTRGRGSAHYTSAGETITVNVNRGTPAPRARPTLKPSTSIVSKASEFVDIYRYPPHRPDPIYPQPQVDKTAAKCRKDVCLLPDCSCGGKEIPGDLPAHEVPQIVLLTFDDAVNELNKGIYEELFEQNRRNPNGCPISATFYVSHEWTDYSHVQNLYADGHELASHTVSHSFGEQFSQKKWYREVAGQREILAAYGGVHLEDVRGMRAPFLSVGGNKMFKMLYDANFTYDSSMPVYENRPPSWPYTLDYKLFHDCMIPPCPTRSYPGVWEVPMVMWQDLNGGRCSMGDACSNPPDADGVYKMLMKNFERHYTTNRAPFGLFYHAAWFTQPHHKEGFIKFLDFLTSQDDVYLVTNWQALQWVRDPTPLSRVKNFHGFQCHYPDRPKRCNNPKVCNLWHKSGVRYMRTCQPCPDIYPWTGKTGIRSSRIDNDIED